MSLARHVRALVYVLVGLALAWAVLLPTRLLAAEFVFPDLKQDGSAVLLLLDAPDGTRLHVLVDAGRRSLKSGRGAALLRELLNRRGINQIDLTIVTHLDEDHAGLETLVGADDERAAAGERQAITIRGPPILIREVITPTQSIPAAKAFWNGFRQSPQAQAIQFITPTETELSRIDARYGIKIFAPPPEFTPKTSNETSLIVTVHDPATGRDLLLTGDLTARAEAVLRTQLPSQVNVLHAPHHGGDRIVHDLAVRLSPDVVVISADLNNRYGHPSPRVLKRLASIGHPTVTDDLGQRVLSREDAVVEDVNTALTSLKPGLWPGSFEQRFGYSDLFRRLEAAARPRPLPPPQPGRPIYYDQILITGERGDIQLDTARSPPSPNTTDAESAIAREQIWNELRYVSDSTLAGLTDWRDAQAYLAIRVAERYRLRDDYLSGSFPSRAAAIRATQETDLTRIVRHVDPKSTWPLLSFAADASDTSPLNASAILAYGQRLVSKERWSALTAKRQEEIRLLWSRVLDRALTRLVGPHSPQSPNITDLVLAAVQDNMDGPFDGPSAQPHLQQALKEIKAAEAERLAGQIRAESERFRKLSREAFEARIGGGSPGIVEALLRSAGVAESGWAALAIRAVRTLPRRPLIP